MQPEPDLPNSGKSLTDAEIAFALAAGVPGRALSEEARLQSQEHEQWSAEVIAAELRSWPTLDDVAGMLNVESLAVRQLVQDGELTSVVIGGAIAIPPWQLTDDGRLLPGLKAVIATLTPHDHPYFVQRLMTFPVDELENRSAREALEEGEPVSLIIEWLSWRGGGGRRKLAQTDREPPMLATAASTCEWAIRATAIQRRYATSPPTNSSMKSMNLRASARVAPCFTSAFTSSGFSRSRSSTGMTSMESMFPA